MADFRCPGQDMRYWKPDDIFTLKCPHCDNEIEFFKDEPFRICSACKAEVRNPKINLGCAKWCKFAKECLGPLADQYTNVASMCDRLIAEMKKVFGDDKRRIDHALKVLDFAEQILKTENADPLVVKAAAILHDIGIHEAERKYNSHHSAKNIDTPEFRIIWDADWLVNLPDEFPDLEPVKTRELITRIFKTRSGLKLAEKLYLK